jgi:hypothetical protein
MMVQPDPNIFFWHSAIAKLFPTIQILDQVPVAPKISFGLGDVLKDADAPEVAVLPVPTKGNFFDNPATQETVLEFLTRFVNSNFTGFLLARVRRTFAS